MDSAPPPQHPRATQHRAAPPRATGWARWALIAVAGLALALGLVGLLLPVMPTVPFLIVAAWAAARCSPQLDHWLHNHPRFGQPLRDWRDGGCVPRRAKWVATLMCSGSAIGLLLFLPQRWAAVGVAVVMALVLVWLWRRPEAPEHAL